MDESIHLNSYYIGDSVWYSRYSKSNESNDSIIPNKIENLIIDVWTEGTENSKIYYKIVGRLDTKEKKIDYSYGSDKINETIFNSTKKSCIFNLSQDYVKIEEEWLFDENLIHIDSYTNITYYNTNIETQYVVSKFVLYKKK